MNNTLVGRDGELVRLEQVISTVRTGRSAVIVVHGGPGTGKTALLARALRRAREFRVIRAAAAESENAYPYAGLQLLCGPLLDRLGSLPSPHREALSAAVGASTGLPPDPYPVGLAALRLLSCAAESDPLLCVLDDAQWMDPPSAQALAFVGPATGRAAGHGAARRARGQPLPPRRHRHAPGQPSADGQQLRAAYVQTSDMALLGVSFTLDGVMVAGDSVAYALTRGTGTIVGKDTGAGSTESNRELFVLGRSDGASEGRPLHVRPATVTVPLHAALPIR